MTVTVCTPSIPPRAARLAEALASVACQERQPEAISVAIDRDHDGAAVTRNRAMAAARTEWVAFLDDDDVLHPQHLRRLLEHADETGADLVYPWFEVHGGTDPFPAFFGQPWSNEEPHIFPVTYLVRRELAFVVGGFPEPGEPEDAWMRPGDGIGEDWGFILRVVAAGARIVHLPERTWRWNHHRGNTSGVTW